MYNDILVLIPAYNEASTIALVIEGLFDKGFKNICVINDGSVDETSSIARKYEIHVIDHDKNMGVGKATKTGLTYAMATDFDYVVTIDADGQHSLDDLKNIADELLSDQYDLVMGNRLDSMKHVNFSRYIINSAADILILLFTFRYIRDTQSGLRGIKRNLFEKLNLRSLGYEVCSEIVILASKLKATIKIVPIKAIYTKYSLLKGQRVSNSVNLIKKVVWLSLTN